MAIFLKGAQSNTVSGLGTFTYNIVSTGTHKVSVNISECPPSGISVVINNNGSSVATKTAPASSQQIISLLYTGAFTAADVVTIVLSSSSAIDALPLGVKTIINIDKVSP